MKTLIKITFNKKFNHFEALTAAANRNNQKIQNFGNDYNIYGATKKEVKNKCLELVKSGLIDDNYHFINN